MTRYDCMTPEELALWRDNQGSYVQSSSPCRDCPLWFELDARARGTCSRATPERREQIRANAKLRPHWREASRRYRASQRALAVGE